MQLEQVGPALQMPFVSWLLAEGRQGLRVFPRIEDESVDGTFLTWAAISEKSGHPLTADTPWSDLVGSHDSVVYFNNQSRIQSPRDSVIDFALFEQLVEAAQLHDSCVGIAIWDGAGYVHLQDVDSSECTNAAFPNGDLEAGGEKFHIGVVSLASIMTSGWDILRAANSHGTIAPQAIWGLEEDWLVVAELDGAMTYFSHGDDSTHSLLRSSVVETLVVPAPL